MSTFAEAAPIPGPTLMLIVAACTIVGGWINRTFRR